MRDDVVKSLGESASTVIPVVLGERGEAMMGSGTVREREKVGGTKLSGLAGRARVDVACSDKRARAGGSVAPA